MIMALDGKNGQIPITRAVWLIYSEVYTEGLRAEFAQNILRVMEEWLAEQQATVTRQQSLDTVQSLLCKLNTYVCDIIEYRPPSPASPPGPASPSN